VFADLVRISHAHHIPLEDVRKCWKDFFSLGVNKDNLLPRESFVAAVRDRCTLPQDTDLPINPLGDDLIMRASNLGEHVDFEGFLQWSLGAEYIEQLLVTDPCELRLRHLARKWDLPLNEIDRIKNIFDHHDKDKMGFLDEAGFMSTVHQLAQLEGLELGFSTIRLFWKELTLKAEKHIGFDEFLRWYVNNCCLL